MTESVGVAHRPQSEIAAGNADHSLLAVRVLAKSRVGRSFGRLIFAAKPIRPVDARVRYGPANKNDVRMVVSWRKRKNPTSCLFSLMILGGSTSAPTIGA